MLQVGRAIPTTPWELVLISSPATWVVLGICGLFSLASWFLIILKWTQFRRIRKQADRFFVEMERAANLQEAYHAVMKLPPSPYGRMLREGMNFFSDMAPALKGQPDPAEAKRTQIELL